MAKTRQFQQKLSAKQGALEALGGLVLSIIIAGFYDIIFYSIMHCMSIVRTYAAAV